MVLLLEGDCRALAGHLNDAFWVSDPPYNQAYHYATYQDNLDVRVYQTLLSDVFRGRMAVVMHYPEELINLVAPALGPVREVLAVAERMVLATTQPGDTIVDPFCGAGTVLLAAALHGRNAVGCDIDPQYLAVAKKRLDAAAIPCKIEKLERKHP